MIKTSRGAATFKIVFSAPVTGFTGSDVVMGGTVGGTKTATISGNDGGSVYTLTMNILNPTSGTVTVRLPPDAAFNAGGSPSLGTTTMSVDFGPAPQTAGESGACGGGSLAGLILLGISALWLRRRR